MKRYLPVIAAAILLGGVAVVQGFWTERWGKYDTQEVTRRVECLDHVEKDRQSFGSWTGKNTPRDEHQLKIAKVSGVVQRQYTNTETGQEVDIYLATGKARAISVHTPDKCYKAAGFRLAEDPVEVPIKYGDNKVATFYMGHFRKDTPEGNLHLTIYWSWNANGTWEAPSVPKITFAKYPALYKLYAIRQMRAGEQYLAEDPTKTFLRELLPVLDEELNKPLPAAGKVAAVRTPPRAS